MHRIVPLLLLSVCPLAAQTDRAAMTGEVRDQNQGVISSALMSVSAVKTGLEYKALTNAAGVYTIGSLPVGEYTASIVAPGFQALQFKNFTLQVGETRTLDAVLKIGSVATEVDVTDAGVNVDQTSAEIGGVIQGSQTLELPINGRSWVRLMALVPGAIDDGGGTEDQVRFAGLSQEDNNFHFDGVDATGINHQFEKLDLRLQLPLEAIAEFHAASAVYSADQGGSAGGQIEVVSKSGTNQFHGAAWEYLRNSAFDARAWNSAALQHLTLNNFGANLGGPIVQNKFFFFANWEAYRQVQAQTLSGLVPSPAYRAQVARQQPALAPLINSYVAGGTPTKDPNAYSWIGAGSNPVQEDSGMARLDYRVNDKTNIFGRYSTDHFVQTFPNGVQVAAGGQLGSAFNSITAPNAVIDLQHVFTPTFTTDARVGYNRDEYHEGGNQVLPFGISITGFSSLGLPSSSDRLDNSFSFVDDTTRVAGRHTIKFGVQVRRVQENKASPNVNQPSLSYISEANFLANIMDSYSSSNQAPVTGQRQTETFAYILDQFQLRPNLTVNAGLRYEYYGIDHEVNGRAIVVDPYTCGQPLVCPNGSAWYNPDTTDLAPRLSLAWSPKRFKGKTVIRTGAGIYYGQGQFGHLGGPIGNLASNFTLNLKQVPGLSYPVTPFLGAAAYSVSYSAQDRNRKNLAVTEWTFSVEQEVARETSVQVSYIGSEGAHLWTNTILNGVNPATGLRPYSGFSSITYNRTDGVSNFNALEIGLRRNLSTGLLISSNYQLSHAIDDGAVGGAEATTPENVACRSCERASSQFDMRSFFSSSAIWTVPVGKGRRYLGNASPVLNFLLGGWQLSGVGTVRSGLPLNVTISRAATALSDQLNGSQRPNIVPGQPLYPADQTLQDWLNLAAFSVPANGAWGNAGRNLVRAPGHWQMDTALEKRFPINERFVTSFRAEAFNIFNIAQYGNPSVNASNATFGLIQSPFSNSPTGSGTPREIELSLKVVF
ncbi:MAG TPA: carboxypeptidase regulatory-like domain-containing protein [Bryobacteraceae bacterium]|jgi:hypothetical protein